MKAIEITMKYEKSTKNTHVFKEEMPENEGELQYFSSIPSLYIRKAAMTELAQKIKVTVEVIK